MAVGAAEIRAVGGHVDVERERGIDERGGEIAVLHVVPAAAVEVAAAAGLRTGRPHVLRHVGDVDRLQGLAVVDDRLVQPRTGRPAPAGAFT